MAYVKLFHDLLDSSLWREDNPTRLMWITLLLKSDENGVVTCSIPGLADAARVTLDECKKALTLFMEPDEFSRTEDFDGRRLEKYERGWIILNYETYKNRKDDKEERDKNTERVRKCRAKKKEVTLGNAVSHDVTLGNAGSPHVDVPEEENENPTSHVHVPIPPSPSIPEKEDRPILYQGSSAVPIVKVGPDMVTAVVEKFKALMQDFPGTVYIFRDTPNAELIISQPDPLVFGKYWASLARIHQDPWLRQGDKHPKDPGKKGYNVELNRLFENEGNALNKYSAIHCQETKGLALYSPKFNMWIPTMWDGDKPKFKEVIRWNDLRWICCDSQPTEEAAKAALKQPFDRALWRPIYAQFQ